MYRKTPLISTYVFSGLATEQVLIFGAVLTFGGYDKMEWKILQRRSLFNPLLSAHNTLVCMFERLCTYFQDTGGIYFRGIATDSKFQQKLKGYLFSEGYLFTGFYGSYTSEAPAPWYSVFGLNILSQTGNTEWFKVDFFFVYKHLAQQSSSAFFLSFAWLAEKREA